MGDDLQAVNPEGYGVNITGNDYDVSIRVVSDRGSDESAVRTAGSSGNLDATVYDADGHGVMLRGGAAGSDIDVIVRNAGMSGIDWGALSSVDGVGIRAAVTGSANADIHVGGDDCDIEVSHSLNNGSDDIEMQGTDN